MEKISHNDQKRILRVLEIYHQTGMKKTDLDEKSRRQPDYDYKVFAIDMERDVLYDRINRRVDIMINNGLIEEVETIYNKYKSFPTAMQALGYKEVVEYLENKVTKEALERRNDRQNKTRIKKICKETVNLV